MKKISNSEVQMFKGCRRRWWFAYHRGLQPREEKFTGPLPLGSRVHLALAVYYTPAGSAGLALGALVATVEEDRERMEAAGRSREEVADFDKEADLARIMVEGYFEWLAETGADSGLHIIEPETEIEAKTEVHGTPVLLVGKRDLVAVDQHGIAQLVDHKSCQSLKGLGLDLNEQARMYLLLQRLNGSTAVQNCTWNLLRKVKRTARAEPPFYAREQLYVSEQELRYFWERLHGEIADILHVEQQLAAGVSHRVVCYPRPSRDCEWLCEFRVACPMIDADPHFEGFLEANYRPGDPYERYQDLKGEM